MIVAVLAVTLVGAIVVVLSGSADVGFVRDRIAATIRSSVGPGYSVTIKRAVIDTDPVLGLVVRVDDTVIRDSANEVVADVPETRFVIDPYSLLRFHVDIRSVELNGPQVSFVRDRAGKVLLGVAGREANDGTGTAPPLAAALAPRVAAADGAQTPAPPAAADPGAADAQPDQAANAGDPPPSAFPDLVSALQIVDHGIEPPIEAATAAGFERLSVVNGTISVWDAGDRQRRRF